MQQQWKKETMDLQEIKEGDMGEFEGRKEKGEMTELL